MCFSFFKDKVDKPDPLEDVDHTEIMTVLRAEMGEDCMIYLSDRDYQVTSKEEIENFLALDDTDKRKYLSEYHDCDDFSYRLHGQFSVPGWSGLAFGILWAGVPGGGHAINCFVDNDKEVWIIEPQNDKIFKLPDDWEPWIVFM